MVARVISPLLKPAKRVKAPKPLARGKRPARVRKSASGRAKHAADLAWAKAVRESGPCWALGRTLGGGFWIHLEMECNGQIEAAHIISRRYAATRHNPANGKPLCHSAHAWFTSHPREWETFCIAHLGRVAYNSLKETALRGTK